MAYRQIDRQTVRPQTGNIREYEVREYKSLFLFVIVFVLPKLSTLDVRNNNVVPQIRILHEISSPEPAPKVWKPKSRSECEEFKCFYANTFSSFSRLPVGFKFGNLARR